MYILLLIAWLSLVGTFWYSLLPAIVVSAVLVSAEVYAVARRKGDYIELLPDGILLTFGPPLWSLRIRYETIASAELKDWWTDRTARALLKIVGRSNPPRVKLRFRQRVFFWWAIWPRKGMYIRPPDPQAVVAALSARLGAT